VGIVPGNRQRSLRLKQQWFGECSRSVPRIVAYQDVTGEGIGRGQGNILPRRQLRLHQLLWGFRAVKAPDLKPRLSRSCDANCLDHLVLIISAQLRSITVTHTSGRGPLLIFAGLFRRRFIFAPGGFLLGVSLRNRLGLIRGRGGCL
jgi:hypothetical protein